MEVLRWGKHIMVEYVMLNSHIVLFLYIILILYLTELGQFDHALNAHVAKAFALYFGTNLLLYLKVMDAIC